MKRVTQNTIASTYGISRSALHRLMDRHALTPSEMSDPALVFFRLLEGRSSQLRSRLADPAERQRIAHALKI